MTNKKFSLINDKNIDDKKEILEEQDEYLEQTQHQKLSKTNINMSIFINFMYDKIHITFNYLHKTITIVMRVSYVYLLWIFFHYLASQLYIKFCVPSNIVGFLISPFLTATPQCQGLRWVIYNGADIINHMWILLGTWLCSNVFLFNKITNYTDQKEK